MASKKKWKKRANTQARIADDLFKQVGTLSNELRVIDEMLLEAEFEGPTIEAYVAQVQQFLQKLVHKRGLVKKSSSGDPNGFPTEQYTSAPASNPSSSIVEGEYDLSVPNGGH